MNLLNFKILIFNLKIIIEENIVLGQENFLIPLLRCLKLMKNIDLLVVVFFFQIFNGLYYQC